MPKRRKAEDSLREAEQFWTAFEQSGVGMAIGDDQGRFLRVNRVLCEMLGYTSDELMQLNTTQITYAGDTIVRWGTAKSFGASVVEKRYTHKSGRPVWVSASVAAMRTIPDQPPHQVEIIHDITERKEAEAALSQSEAEMRALVGGLPDVIMVLGRDGTYIKIAPSAANLLYRPSDELVGKSVRDVLPREAADFIMAHIERALDTRRPVKVAYSLDIGGNTVWFEGNVSPMPDDTVVWVARDITEQRQVEEQLRASERRHRLLFQHSPFPMWLYDVETLAILDVNEIAVSSYGYTRQEFLTLRVPDLLAGEEAPQILALRAAAGSGRAQVGPHSHRKKDGTLITVEVVSEDAEVEGRAARLVLARDITEQEILEAQFRQSQKMEAVGQLAGGVAHDFNNLLTAIRGYSDIILESLAPNDSRRDDVGEISKAAERAGALTRQLLAFSRKQILQPRVLDLNAVVAGLESMLRRLIGEDVELVTRAAPTLGPLKADIGQLEQVLVNLVVNARDAMPNGGTLTIETAEVHLDELYGPRHGAIVAPGPYVMIAVTDTGIGMDRVTLSHVFEPFFTTKGMGKGTGLGLSTVYGIVKQSGGFVWVYSEPEHGTTFKIYFPMVSDSVQPATPVPELVLERRGNETLLLVEDEDTVRNLATRILEKHGYTVLSAHHGREAVKIAAEYAGDIHLVITDVVMPGMGGRELASALSSVRPEAPVLYISGYTDDEIMRRGMLDPAMAFLEKPFTASLLTRRVREILDGLAR